MCIALLTTAHPAYALMVLDNRDEFILRPTSRPHWWASPHQDILAARDLQRDEQGTWLGVTRTGKLAVLTNFRESNPHDAAHPVQGQRSRGGMVTAWLTSATAESTPDFVRHLLGGDGVKGVGGFSLICGRLRRRTALGRDALEPLAVISNRCEDSQDVPWIAGERDQVYGLSNTSFNDPVAWPKVVAGKRLLRDLVRDAVAQAWDEEQLAEQLYALLSTDTAPARNGQAFDEYTSQLKKSIFVPPIEEIVPAPSTGPGGAPTGNADFLDELRPEERPDPEPRGAMAGCYGTQRQTIILLDWHGNLTFRERALWDEEGNPIARGNGDVKFHFTIEGWDDEAVGCKMESGH